MNIPYVKEYNELGLVSNPITKDYLHDSNNRKKRREVKQKSRFIGNGKQTPLTVYKSYRYVRRIQVITHRNHNSGYKSSTIKHYDLCNS